MFNMTMHIDGRVNSFRELFCSIYGFVLCESFIRVVLCCQCVTVTALIVGTVERPMPQKKRMAIHIQ